MYYPGVVIFLIILVSVKADQCEVVLPDPPQNVTWIKELEGNETLKVNERIVYGRRALGSTRQYLVSIHRTSKSNIFCTGSLLSPRWVLTAAHCKVKKWNFIRLGGDRALDGVLRRIAKVISHEKFGFESMPLREIMDDDIAILQLAEPAPSFMKFVHINTDLSIPKPRAWARVAGYGRTENRAEGIGILRSVDVPVKSSTRCTFLFGGNLDRGASIGLRIKNRLQFCAGYKNGGCDSCQGDSGGPLFVYDESFNPVQVGLTSFGIGCGRKSRPGVYVRVASYVEWMARNGAIFTNSSEGRNHMGGKEVQSALDDFNFVCFPGSSTVQLKDGTYKSMEQLALGDIVLTSAGEFSSVFMFTHRIAEGEFSFVELAHAQGDITISNSHYIFLNGELRPAGQAQVGDLLEIANGSYVPIEKVRSVVGNGLYNPQTIAGTIVVDGVKASAYTAALRPVTAHALLRPLSAIYRLLNFDLSSGFFEKIILT